MASPSFTRYNFEWELFCLRAGLVVAGLLEPRPRFNRHFAVHNLHIEPLRDPTVYASRLESSLKPRRRHARHNRLRPRMGHHGLHNV